MKVCDMCKKDNGTKVIKVMEYDFDICDDCMPKIIKFIKNSEAGKQNAIQRMMGVITR